MMPFPKTLPLSHRQRLGLGGAALLVLGAAGGAGAISLTRPSVEMAPTVSTAVAHLGDRSGVVTVRGKVAEVYGDRFVVQDASGRALVDVGRGGAADLRSGSPVLVQGRYDDGQLRARFLVDAAGAVREVGGRPHRGHEGRGGHEGREGHDGPPPPPPGADAPPPPPPPASAGAQPTAVPASTVPPTQP